MNNFLFIALMIPVAFVGHLIGRWLGRRSNATHAVTVSTSMTGRVDREAVDRIVEEKQAALVAELIEAMKAS